MDTSSEFLFLSFFIFSSAIKVTFKFPLFEASFYRKKNTVHVMHSLNKWNMFPFQDVQ